MEKKFIKVINYNKNTSYKCTTLEPVIKMNYNYFVGKKTTKNKSYNYKIKEEKDKDWFDKQTNKIWCSFEPLLLNLDNDVNDSMDSRRWLAFRIKQRELYQYATKINIKRMWFFHKTWGMNIGNSWSEDEKKWLEDHKNDYFRVGLYGSVLHQFLENTLKKNTRAKIFYIERHIFIDQDRFIYYDNEKKNLKVNSIYYDLNNQIIYLTIHPQNYLFKVDAKKYNVVFINYKL